MTRAACAWLCGALLAACETPTAPPPAAAASATRAAKSSAVARTKPPKRARASRAAPSTKLAALRLDTDGRLVGELEPGRRAVRVVLSTREQPLAPRAPAAHRAIAELIVPGLVPPTELRAVPLAELVGAASDDRTRRMLAKHARVVADGTVLATSIETPAGRLKTVDLGDIAEGRRAWSWESKLLTKESPTESQRAILARYQQLLAIDYLAENLVRREVLFDESAATLVPIDDNAAFSPRPSDRAVGDAFKRLSAHLTYSDLLARKLAALDQPAVDAALRVGPDRSLLATPKQLGEVLERKRSLERQIEMRIRQRGRAVALALP